MSLRSRKSLKAFEVEHQKEQAVAEEQRTAPIRAAAQRVATLEQQIADTESAIVRDSIFTKPSSALAAQCTPYNKSLTAEQVSVAIGSSVSALKLHLSEKGITLTDAGLAKIGRVVEVNPTVDITESSELQKIYDYLDTNDCFTDRDREITVQVVAQPQIEAEAPDIESFESQTREGQAKARRIAFDGLLREAQPIFSAFRDHMRSVWNHPMTDADQERCVQYCVTRNLGFNAAAFDKCRVDVLGCRLPDEKLAQTIENSDKPVGDYAVKQDIARRIKAVTGQ